jgi:CubicO group peptidase (beta-lactamase class C family)
VKAFILAGALLLGAGGEASAADRRLLALDRDIPKLLAERRVPSVSIAHIENGRIAFAVAYGEQSPGVPATQRTLYNVASLTKPIAAEVVLRLAAQGKLSLDEPMHPVWTDPDVASDERHKLLTPRIALSHQTGFPNWRWMAKDKRLAFGHAPGRGVGYSGEGYEYFARFAEKKTGEPFQTLAEKLVFAPAGIKDTSFTERPWFKGRLARPTNQEGKPIKPTIRSTFLASDDIHTTATDYARFMISVMNRKGLTPELIAERERVQADTRPIHCTGTAEASCPYELGFGLGWEVHKYPGRTILWHTGADNGEFAVAFLNPDTRNGSVILTSSRRGMEVIIDIMERLETDPVFLRAMKAQAAK